VTAFVPFFLRVQGKCTGGQSEIVVDIFVWLIHLSCRWHTKVNKESFLKTKYVFMCFVEGLTRGHKVLRVAL